MAQKTVTQRLAGILVYLEQTFGKNDDDSIAFQLSREEIAAMAGATLESCIRLLSGFKKDGLIKLDGRKIWILDGVGLRRKMV